MRCVWMVGLAAASACHRAAIQPAPVVTPAGAAQATQANAPEQPIASDGLARAQLVDLRNAAPGVRFELRYATTNNFTSAVLPGYGAAVPLFRAAAATALARVERDLESRGLGLKVWDAYRPVRATLGMVAWCEQHHRVDLLDSGYIARRSRHNQGVAIDLTAIDLRTGVELEMGTPFDEFSARAHTASASGRVALNRALLGDAMRRQGFVNYTGEWWHFSFDLADAVPYDLPLESWKK